ncbi:MAG: tRNA pseudouridine(55) synthase TruB [Clostridia bacterium]|nr:tRNA pseudouridine(55) synthase TruB [Clostridia bacterium]
MTGFINIDKESGKSSAFAVNRIKRLTGTPCGHMGTLDPLASGVLPVGVGKASRLFDYFLAKKKEYIARFRFGATSDTLDSEGEVTQTTEHIPTQEEIRSVLPSFVGEIDQVPPLYSAKSVGGRRGYELARAGVEFTLPAKRIRIDEIELLEQVSEDSFTFRIACGGGTYIRSLARDVAEKTGSLGMMTALRRTQSGFFTLDTAVKLETLTEENVGSFLIPTDAVLPFPTLKAEGEERRKLLNGIKLHTDRADGSYKLYIDELFYGIAEVNGGVLSVRTKLC